MTDPRYYLAIDIGGTFTDIILLNQAAGSVAVAKVLTSYPDPAQAVLAGVRDLLEKQAVSSQKVRRVIHGTTLVTNTLIERKGAKTALLTTKGFRDALEIGREGRYDIYDLELILPNPLVERRLRLEVPERMDAQGEILETLDEAALEALCRQLQPENIDALAITFLHAYANPTHERQAATIVHQMLPNVALTLSHEVAPELREYERTSTTVANAYVQPLTKRYLHRLEAGLQAINIQAPLHIMLSNAGTCAVDTAAAYPIRLVESGPCGGALAGAYWGQKAGRPQVISHQEANQKISSTQPDYTDVLAFDMGGTTAKAILSIQGEFPITTKAEVARVHRFKRGSGLPLLVPMLEMIEIGAGGGSIAQLNELKLPTVGPESAGSTPGPACYDRGGELPTVTDADLLLGYLNPNYFVGGNIQLDPTLAKTALSGLAQALDMDIARCAWGVHQLVNEDMAGAVRVHAAERGLDLRKYTMVATGGAGPVHACGVAQGLNITRVIVPPIAGVGSAFGMLLAPISFDFTRSYVVRLADINWPYINQLLTDLETQGKKIVSAAGVAEDEVQVSRTADMRYVGQGFEIRIALPDEHLQETSAAVIQTIFDQAYTQLYGRLCEGIDREMINWRVVVSGPQPHIQNIVTSHATDKTIASLQTEKQQPDHRAVLFEPDLGFQNVPVYNHYTLLAGFETSGPAIIEEAESTSVVLPNWSAKMNDEGSLVLSRGH